MYRCCGAYFLLILLLVSTGTACCHHHQKPRRDQLPGEDGVTFALHQTLAWSVHIVQDRLIPIEYLSRVSGYMHQRKLRMVSSNGTRYAGGLGGALIDGVALPPSSTDVHRYRDKVHGRSSYDTFWPDVDPQPDPEFAAHYPHFDNFYRFSSITCFDNFPYFAEMDTDGDGRGSEEEMRTYFLSNNRSRRWRTRGASTVESSNRNRTYRRSGISIDAAEGIVPTRHRDDVFPPELYGMYFRPPGQMTAGDGNASEAKAKTAGEFDNDLVVRLPRRGSGPSRDFQYHPPTVEFTRQQLENGVFGDDIYDYTYQPTYPYDLMDFGFIQKSLDASVYNDAVLLKLSSSGHYTSRVADKTSVGTAIHDLLVYISTISMIPAKPIDLRASSFIQHFWPRHLIAPPLPILPDDVPPALEELAVSLMSPNPSILVRTKEVIKRFVENGFASLPLHRFLNSDSANTTSPVSFGLTYKYFRMWWQALYEYDDDENTTTNVNRRMGYVYADADGTTNVSYREHYGARYVKQYDPVEPEDVNTFNQSYYLATRGEEFMERYDEEPTTVTQTLIIPVLVDNATATPTEEPGTSISIAVIVAVAAVLGACLLVAICLTVVVLYHWHRSRSSSSLSPPSGGSYPKPSAATASNNPLSPSEVLVESSSSQSQSQLMRMRRHHHHPDGLLNDSSTPLSRSQRPSQVTESYYNDDDDEPAPAAGGVFDQTCGGAGEDRFTVRSGHTMTALEMLRDGWTIYDGTSTTRSVVESASRPRRSPPPFELTAPDGDGYAADQES